MRCQSHSMTLLRKQFAGLPQNLELPIGLGWVMKGSLYRVYHQTIRPLNSTFKSRTNPNLHVLLGIEITAP